MTCWEREIADPEFYLLHVLYILFSRIILQLE